MAQSRKDLVQAHRLMTQRAALALVRGEPDLPDQPLRRLNVGAISSVLAGVIAVALFAILAALKLGAPPALRAGDLVIDAQTGTSYVFCGKGGRDLCPALNYASARLALGAPPLQQVTVSQSALDGYPRGRPFGIAGLPQPLPAPGMLITGPWAVCTQDRGTGGQRAVTSVSGGIQTGGRPLRSGGALLVQSHGTYWLIWQGGGHQATRLKVVQPDYIAALSTAARPVTAQSAVQVSSAWLDALPAGPPLMAPPIPGWGSPTTGPDGNRTEFGQVYTVAGSPGGAVYYVKDSAGTLASITPMQADLLEHEPGAPNGGKPKSLAPSLVGRPVTLPSPPGLPRQIPAMASAGHSAAQCVVYSRPGPGGGALEESVTVGGRLPPGAVPTGIPTDATEVALAPGHGALVGSAPGTGKAVNYFLVAGGYRYALARQSVAGMLGYSLSQAVALPAGVVDLIPQGPALDPRRAKNPAPVPVSGG